MDMPSRSKIDRSIVASHSSVIATEVLIPYGSTVYLLGGDEIQPHEMRDDLLVLGFPHDEGGWVYESRGQRWYWPAEEVLGGR